MYNILFIEKRKYISKIIRFYNCDIQDLIIEFLIDFLHSFSFS